MLWCCSTMQNSPLRRPSRFKASSYDIGWAGMFGNFVSFLGLRYIPAMDGNCGVNGSPLRCNSFFENTASLDTHGALGYVSLLSVPSLATMSGSTYRMAPTAPRLAAAVIWKKEENSSFSVLTSLGPVVQSTMMNINFDFTFSTLHWPFLCL